VKPYTPKGSTFALDFDNGDSDWSLADVKVPEFDPNRPRPQAPKKKGPIRIGARRTSMDELLALRPDPNAEGDVLVVNSYGGSLLLAAKAAGLSVMASLEDAAYGLPAQRTNFPELKGRFAGQSCHWPRRSLRDTVVFSHPPCAAFSAQQTAERSTDHKKFQQSKFVMEYALGQGTPALLVESVVATMEGARAFHDQVAAQHGYECVRILQNAATFGVPQWRPRFWMVFLRRDLIPASGWLSYDYRPRTLTMGELMPPGVVGVPVDPVVSRLEKNRKVTVEQAGLSWEQVSALERGLAGYGRWWKLVAKAKGMQPNEQAREALAPLFSKFEAKQFHVIDPARFSPTLMKDSLWLCNGRVPNQAEYRMAMGFPHDYVLPSDPRELLSRGVCPPVAEWVLRTANAWARGESVGEERVRPGGTIDLRPPNTLR
jgi:site-specific DNA-cytosine methylase